MARPKSSDPRTQRNIYPLTSVWDRIAALAASEGKPTSEVAVRLMMERLEQVAPAGELERE
jgi:hypothetical protein